MRKDPPGIVGPDGRPLYVVGGQAIGAEHLNAGLDWTRRYDAAATKEHDRDGRHARGYLAKAVLHGRMPRWGPNQTTAGDVYPDSCIYGHRQDTWDGPGPLFDLKETAIGEALVTMALPMPSADYTILICGYPVLIYDGQPGGLHVPGWLRATPVSATEFRLQLDGPNAFWRGRDGRVPFLAVLHGM